MNKRELRYGNWLFSSFINNNFIVTQLHDDVVNGRRHAQDVYAIYYRNLEPIRLTPEVIGKIKGMKLRTVAPDSWYEMELKGGFRLFEGSRDYAPNIVVIEFNDYELKKCSFLHELQNVVYDLTGVELKMDL